MCVCAGCSMNNLDSGKVIVRKGMFTLWPFKEQVELTWKESLNYDLALEEGATKENCWDLHPDVSHTLDVQVGGWFANAVGSQAAT